MGWKQARWCETVIKEVSKMNVKDNGAICPLVWHSIGMSPHGRIRTCGRARPKNSPTLRTETLEQSWNSEYYKDIRQAMVNGVKHSNCSNCYYQEEKGGNSKRLDSILIYGLDFAKDIVVKRPPVELDVRVGNICNLKCVHCWTGNSSKWYEDKNMLDKYSNTENYSINNKWIDSDSQVWKYLRENIEGIEKLNFLGGEPFASKQHNQFIDWCLENNQTHFELHYVTNGTLNTPKMMDKIKNFTLNLMISLDDFGERSDFLRFPGKWENIYKNLKYISTLDIRRCLFNWTAYNLNIGRLDELVDYVGTHFSNIEFWFGDYVTQPAHMSVQNLPKHYKEKVAKKLKGIKPAEFYVNFMMDKDLWQEQGDILYNYLNDLDKARKTNWRKTLPEIAELWTK